MRLRTRCLKFCSGLYYRLYHTSPYSSPTRTYEHTHTRARVLQISDNAFQILPAVVRYSAGLFYRRSSPRRLLYRRRLCMVLPSGEQSIQHDSFPFPSEATSQFFVQCKQTKHNAFLGKRLLKRGARWKIAPVQISSERILQLLAFLGFLPFF